MIEYVLVVMTLFGIVVGLINYLKPIEFSRYNKKMRN